MSIRIAGGFTLDALDIFLQYYMLHQLVSFILDLFSADVVFTVLSVFPMVFNQGCSEVFLVLCLSIFLFFYVLHIQPVTFCDQKQINWLPHFGLTGDF